MFLLVLAYPGCPGQTAIKWMLLLLLQSGDDMFAESECDSSSTVRPTKLPCVDNKNALSSTESVSLQNHEFKHLSNERCRARKQCPLCGLVVTHLPRHLRSCAHNWKADEARAAIGRFQLRKMYTYKHASSALSKSCRKSLDLANKHASSNKDYHHRTRCPYPHCQSVVNRLSRHLAKVHNVVNKRLLRRCVDMAKQKLANKADTDDSGDTDVELDMGVYAVADAHDTDVEPDDGVEDDSNSDGLVKSSIQSQQTGFQFDSQSFLKWLTGPDGGRIDNRSAQQHVRQIKNIIGHADEKSCAADLLIDKDYILEKFLNGYAVQCQYQPGTIRSHLASLIHLYDFWLLSSVYPHEKKSGVHSMKESVKRWMTSYRKDVNRRCLKKMDAVDRCKWRKVIKEVH